VTFRALVGLSLLSAAGSVAAQPARGPALSFEGCREDDMAEIRRLVAIDLGPAPARGAGTALSIRCHESTWELSIPSASLRRSLDFASTPGTARARQTAIVVGELVAEAAAEREAKPTPAPAPPPETPRETDRTPPAPQRHRFRVSLLGGGRTLFGGIPRLLGGAARLEDLAIPWGLDALYEQGTATTSEGLVAMRALSGGLSLAWQEGLGGVSVRVGGGVRAGAVWMEGEPRAGSAVQGLELVRGWAGPLVTGSLALPLQGRLALGLVVEGGYTLLPVYGLVDGRREAAFRGYWLGAQVGLGVSL
jgi:hypothetical protein